MTKATTAKPYRDDPEIGQKQEEEQTSLLAGYGSTTPDEYTKNKYQKQYGIYSDSVDSNDVDVIDGTIRNRVNRVPKWVWLTSGLALYVCTVGAAWTHQRESGARLVLSNDKQEILDVELLGKAKKSKKDGKKKNLKGGKKEKKAPFEPVVYPGCAGYVDIKYVKEPLTFKEHEAAAAAADCHLASIHNLDENTKYSKSGLFKMSYGPGTFFFLMFSCLLGSSVDFESHSLTLSHSKLTTFRFVAPLTLLYRNRAKLHVRETLGKRVLVGCYCRQT